MSNFCEVFPEFPLTEEEFKVIDQKLRGKNPQELEYMILQMSNVYLTTLKALYPMLSDKDKLHFLQHFLGGEK